MMKVKQHCLSPKLLRCTVSRQVFYVAGLVVVGDGSEDVSRNENCLWLLGMTKRRRIAEKEYYTLSATIPVPPVPPWIKSFR